MSDIIGDILVREGGSTVTNDPTDRGGKTQYGLSQVNNPGAWADGKVTEEEARAIYQRKYIDIPHFNQLPSILQPLCIDWGVVSGPQLVIGELQAQLKLPIDHILGTQTLAALPLTPEGLISLTNRLVARRIMQVGRIISKDSSQAKYAAGWLSRALSFLLV